MFLFLIIYIRELIKDLENIKGDFTLNYQTIPVIYGEKASKYLITFSVLLTIVIIYLLLSHYDTGSMYYYYYFSLMILILFVFILWNSNNKKNYNSLHNLLKFVIVLGVLSIVLIDVELFLEKFYLLLNYYI
jgi:4-hydroxybenzoate polyprenyltransferase